MTEAMPQETREVSPTNYIERSDGSITESLLTTVQALGGPAAIAGAAKFAKDVVVAKIQANAHVEVARIENGDPTEGGAHRRV
jgi:hypothetical protein